MEPIQRPIYPILRPEDDWNTIDLDRNRTITFTDIYYDPNHKYRIRTNVCSQGIDFVEEDGCFEMNVPLPEAEFEDFYYEYFDDLLKNEYYSNRFRCCWWRIKVIPPTSERDVGFEQSKGGVMLCFQDEFGGRRTCSVNDFGAWTDICLIIVKATRGFLKSYKLKHMYKTSLSKTEHMYMETFNPFGHSEYYMCLFRKKKLLKDDMERQLREPHDYQTVEHEDDGMVSGGEDL